MKLLPQEIEVWYLIPAIRRELTETLIFDFGMSQKKISEILGLTESAVSQYLKSKRGNEIKFSEKEKEIIKSSAANIVEGENADEELYRLSVRLRACESLCNFHKRNDKGIRKDCDLCVEYN